MNIHQYTASQIAQQITANKFSANTVSDYFRDRAKSSQNKLNAFVEIYDTPVESKGSSSLAGVPIAIKDNICLHGKRITCASKILNQHISVYDATVVTRLKSAGINIIGSLNMDEFAFGSSTENSCYGVVKNPWDLTCVPGGSSGGSAAAVASRLVPMALGSDTGGSIRQPAALCGVVGFKPTYGRVSRYGLIAFGSSLDQIGTFTTDFTDCSHLLNIICGTDHRDSTSSLEPVPDFTQSLNQEIKGLRIGVAAQYFGQGLDPQIKQAVDQVIEFYQQKGCKLVPIQLPHTEYAVAVYYIIGASEASSNLQRFDGIRYGSRSDQAKNLQEVFTKTRAQGFGDEAKRRIFLGTYSLSSGYYDAYYMKALKVRRLIKQDFDQAFDQVDAIITPTSPTAAFKIGEKSADPLSMYLSDIYTISANLAGLPAVSFPCGFTKNKLPIGCQLIGKEFDESTLIKMGHSFQRFTDYHQQIPEMFK